MSGIFSRRKSDSADSRLYHLETMFAALSGRQGCVELSVEGIVETANAKFLEIVGYGLEEISGRPHNLFLFPDQRDSAADREFWAQLRRGQPISDKFRRAAKGGRETIFYATYYPLQDPTGKVYKIVAWGADLTEMERSRKAIEDERAAKAAEQERVFNSLGSALKALAEGDLTVALDRDLPRQYDAIRADFSLAVERLRDAMGGIAGNADGMRSGAGEITQAADDLSRRTEQQAATLEETAAALEEITATVKRTADGANQANAVVGAAKLDAEKSGEVVRDAVAAMSQIEQSAQQISQIIGVIDEIAFQTNLLALNAGVEAARAGDAGRGFAVVASEVRALAQRSAEAAKEIKALISASTQQVKQGVDLVGQTGEALQRIVSKVADISGLVSEITASAQEQATGLSQVNTAVNQMDQVTQQNAAMVEQSTAASHSLLDQADELVRLVSRFRTGEERRTASARPAASPSPNRQTAPQM